MPGGEKRCDDCQELYHQGTNLSEYGCRCLRAKYTAAKTSRERFNDVQPTETTEGGEIGGRVQCADCWEFYNKGTNLRQYGCVCFKAKAEAVFAGPGKFCEDDKCYSYAAKSGLCNWHAKAASKTPTSANPFEKCKQELKVGDNVYTYYSIRSLNDPRVAKLPYSIRVLLECAVRNADDFEITKDDVENILNWQETATKDIEIPFKPARVLLQDFTGVPSVVDLAAMREAMKRLGGDPTKINPLVPAELVIDHSVQVDFAREPDATKKNLDKEMERNSERFQFLKWDQIGRAHV